MPIAVVLSARRPFHLIGSSSAIELLPYVLEVRAGKRRSSLFAAGDDEPAAPAMQLDRTNPTLLRSVSGAPETGPVAMLGCGSVGSKMAMHLARCGIEIPVLCDENMLMPHNMARHALARSPLAAYKASELADELAHLGQSPQVHKGDLVADLATREGRQAALPSRAACAHQHDRLLSVREALSALSPKDVKPRLAEAALFGRGHGGFLLVEGAPQSHPVRPDRGALRHHQLGAGADLLFDPDYGLAEVQIGQGCGSLTMPMTDMRLSAMTAGLTEALVDQMRRRTRRSHHIGATGEVRGTRTGTRKPSRPSRSSRSSRWRLDSTHAQRVLDEIRAEMGRYPAVETGGLMIGTCSARLKAVTVVDLLPAPPDRLPIARPDEPCKQSAMLRITAYDRGQTPAPIWGPAARGSRRRITGRASSRYAASSFKKDNAKLSTESRPRREGGLDPESGKLAEGRAGDPSFDIVGRGMAPVAPRAAGHRLFGQGDRRAHPAAAGRHPAGGQPRARRGTACAIRPMRCSRRCAPAEHLSACRPRG